ncbi:MAG: hypothetical protein CSA49_03455 [Gammaproteobacteria bacterium]|nr:MAG: hypothetical protein CSA49_03455 [Gammaproteobacteria bacterium]
MSKQISDTVTLYRAVGPGQLKRIAESGWKKFPSRLHWQPYFYPMLHEAFARKIASEWNVQQSGVGYVLRFKVRKSYVERLPIYMVGGPEHTEYRIAANELPGFNDNIVGSIELMATYNEQPRQSLWKTAVAWA